MKMDPYQMYARALSALVLRALVVEDGGELVPLLPHIPAHIIASILASIELSGGEYVFIAPPVRTPNMVHRIRVCRVNGKFTATWFGTDEDVTETRAAEAARYADRNWRNRFGNGRPWDVYFEWYLRDPFEGQQRPRFIIGAGLVERAGVSTALGSETTSEMIDRHIVIVGASPAERAEIRGKRPLAGAAYNCAYCGGGLGMTTCCGCQKVFSSDGTRRYSWTIALPPSIQTAAEANCGHAFRRAPALARGSEGCFAFDSISGLMAHFLKSGDMPGWPKGKAKR